MAVRIRDDRVTVAPEGVLRRHEGDRGRRYRRGEHLVDRVDVDAG